MPSIAVVGPSGEGKSSSYGQIPEIGITGLNPKETVVINVASKDLPFRAWAKSYNGEISKGGNYLPTADANIITQAINFISVNRPDIKNIVIDDAQFILSFEFMRRAKESGLN